MKEYSKCPPSHNGRQFSIFSARMVSGDVRVNCVPGQRFLSTTLQPDRSRAKQERAVRVAMEVGFTPQKSGRRAVLTTV